MSQGIAEELGGQQLGSVGNPGATASGPEPGPKDGTGLAGGRNRRGQPENQPRRGHELVHLPAAAITWLGRPSASTHPRQDLAVLLTGGSAGKPT